MSSDRHKGTAVTPKQPWVHPTASVGANTSIGAGATIGEGADLSVNVVVDAGVRIGAGSSIGAGVYLAAGTLIGESVVVGPNATVVGSGFGRAGEVAPPLPTTICDGVSIGTNASVLAGVTIGANAVIGAGSVVTRDVPPFATAVGAPARIVGYQSSPGFVATRQLRASALDDGDFPMEIGRATLSSLPLITDLRGSLSFGETPTHLPFTPKRYFLIFDVPSREVRGEHAHRTLHQLLICVHGECAVAIDDGTERGQIVLDRPDAALHLPPMVWGSEYHYSSDAVLLVLASDVYDAGDYIRTYDAFRAALRDE
jgi:UDP-2-acetamido-3-amino-2,3-dideoxy-glucuronate N-acetyltransferase